MRKLNTFIVVSLAGLALAATGCKKDKKTEDPGPGTAAASGSSMAGSGTAAGSSMAGSGTAAGSSMAGSGTAAGSGSATAPVAATADKLEIFAQHTDPKKPDVTVTFDGIKVVEAKFDPEKIEGGTATIEIDLGSLKSGVDDRDAHLKNPDYLEVDKFPKATVKVDNVKKAGDAYSADATVNVHGVEQKVPVTFTVAEKAADWVRINGEAKFSRLDFKIGKAEKDEGSKEAMTAKLTVTLKKS